jgi:hypothetical protein
VKIEKFYATLGDNNGEIDLQWEPSNGSKYYVLEMCIKKTGNPRWKTIDMVSRSSYKVTGLKKSVTYQFRVAGVNSKGQGGWSSEISKKL